MNLAKERMIIQNMMSTTYVIAALRVNHGGNIFYGLGLIRKRDHNAFHTIL